MIPVLLIAVPLLAGLIGFMLKDGAAKGWALFASLVTLGISLIAVALPEASKELAGECGMAYRAQQPFCPAVRRAGRDTLPADNALLSHYLHRHLGRAI